MLFFKSKKEKADIHLTLKGDALSATYKGSSYTLMQMLIIAFASVLIKNKISNITYEQMADALRNDLLDELKKQECEGK